MSLCASEIMKRGAEAECESCKRNPGKFSKIYGIYICSDCLNKIIDRKIKQNIRSLDIFKKEGSKIKLIYFDTPLCRRAIKIFEGVYKNYSKRFNLSLKKVKLRRLSELEKYSSGIFAIPNEISFLLTFSDIELKGKNMCKDLAEYELLQFDNFEKYINILESIVDSDFFKKILDIYFRAVHRNPSYVKTSGKLYWRIYSFLQTKM